MTERHPSTAPRCCATNAHLSFPFSIPSLLPRGHQFQFVFDFFLRFFLTCWVWSLCVYSARKLTSTFSGFLASDYRKSNHVPYMLINMPRICISFPRDDFRDIVTHLFSSPKMIFSWQKIWGIFWRLSRSFTDIVLTRKSIVLRQCKGFKASNHNSGGLNRCSFCFYLKFNRKS